MGFPSDLAQREEFGEWAIIHGYRGSIAHGMYLPNNDPNSVDDKDTMCVFVPPLDYYIGTKRYGRAGNGTKEFKHHEWDIVAYELKKFIHLLTKGNPNVLMLLWLEDNYYIKLCSAGEILINSRDVFAAKHVYKSFTGYAHGQLHRMTHNAFKGHMGEKRRSLVEKYGYDTKNAAHLIRILRMGKEFLLTGELNVLREDASQLLEIKKGEWSLEQVKELADKEFANADYALAHSKLPDKPDYDAINTLTMDIVSNHLSIRS